MKTFLLSLQWLLILELVGLFVFLRVFQLCSFWLGCSWLCFSQVTFAVTALEFHRSESMKAFNITHLSELAEQRVYTLFYKNSFRVAKNQINFVSSLNLRDEKPSMQDPLTWNMWVNIKAAIEIKVLRELIGFSVLILKQIFSRESASRKCLNINVFLLFS